MTRTKNQSEVWGLGGGGGLLQANPHCRMIWLGFYLAKSLMSESLGLGFKLFVNLHLSSYFQYSNPALNRAAVLQTRDPFVLASEDEKLRPLPQRGRTVTGSAGSRGL